MRTNFINLYKRWWAILLDLVMVAFSICSSFLLTQTNFSIHVLTFILLEFLVVFISFFFFRLYNMVYKYAGLIEFFSIILASIIVLLFNLGYVLVTRHKYFGFSIAILSALLVLCSSVVTRFGVRTLVTLSHNQYVSTLSSDKRWNVMIIGGGDAGIAIIKDLKESSHILKTPVCIIDDNEEKIGNYIYQIPVVGNRHTIVENVDKYKVDEIILCLPSVSSKERADILNICKNTKCKVSIVPGLYQIVNGSVSTSQIRDVEISDLLGREQVQVNLDEITTYLKNKVVLVTGGGGSIGSELCRQIAKRDPKLLIILDIYENNAYDIEQELKRSLPNLNLLTLIASVRDEAKINDVFEKYHPDIVFNAAAHKHVPLMETSPNEAIKNNVFGTLNVARAADKYGTKKFVQISTDKAVNPTNIMGASKRICEMIIQTIGKHSKTCDFVAVRFGNVLGSNGSVIPLFKKQIKEGGPVTVTHKDIIRYFMTIPEAVSLVLQAGAYAKKGQIFVLDMGDPVRIYDLAENLIKLSGLTPGEDIKILITGLRPGEKLYEERLMAEEGLQKTPNGLINIAKPIALDESTLWTDLDELKLKAHEETSEMKHIVKKLVTTYIIDEK